MTNKRIKIEEINKRIYNCTDCSFFEEIPKGIPFKPDISYVFPDSDLNYEAMVIGINPGRNPYYFDDPIMGGKRKSWYNNKRYEDFIKVFEPIEGGPYRNKLCSLFNKISSRLEISKQNFTEEDIFRRVFWGNLSFCGSKNIYKREIGPKTIKCNFEEEINTCLQKGYLKSFIDVIKPKFILFFTNKIRRYSDFKDDRDLLKQLLGENIESYEKKQEFDAYERKDKKIIKVKISAHKVNENGFVTKVLFFPHPNFNFRNDYKDKALDEVCDFLK